MFIKNCVVLTCWPIRTLKYFIQGKFTCYSTMCCAHFRDVWDIKTSLGFDNINLEYSYGVLVCSFFFSFQIFHIWDLKRSRFYRKNTHSSVILIEYFVHTEKSMKKQRTKCKVNVQRISWLNQKFTICYINFMNCWKHRYLRCLSQQKKIGDLIGLLMSSLSLNVADAAINILGLFANQASSKQSDYYYGFTVHMKKKATTARSHSCKRKRHV